MKSTRICQLNLKRKESELTCDAAANHIGWNLITIRKEIKAQRLRENYISLDKEVKRSACRNKRKWTEDLDTNAQTAAE